MRGTDGSPTPPYLPTRNGNRLSSHAACSQPSGWPNINPNQEKHDATKTSAFGLGLHSDRVYLEHRGGRVPGRPRPEDPASRRDRPRAGQDPSRSEGDGGLPGRIDHRGQWLAAQDDGLAPEDIPRCEVRGDPCRDRRHGQRSGRVPRGARRAAIQPRPPVCRVCGERWRGSTGGHLRNMEGIVRQTCAKTLRPTSSSPTRFTRT